jgi:hypothetical protein
VIAQTKNKVPRRPAWTNKPVVTVAEPGRVFAFARTEKFAGTVEWRYRFDPDDGGTTVTESYEVTKPLTRFGWFIIGTLFGRADRRTDLRAGMEQTLHWIRDTAEGSVRPAAGAPGETNPQLAPDRSLSVSVGVRRMRPSNVYGAASRLTGSRSNRGHGHCSGLTVPDHPSG